MRTDENIEMQSKYAKEGKYKHEWCEEWGTVSTSCALSFNMGPNGEGGSLTLSHHSLWSFYDAVMNQYTPCHPLREDERWH